MVGSDAPFPISRTFGFSVDMAAKAGPAPATVASPAVDSTAARPKPSHLVPRGPSPPTVFST
jgi:hypothetical protein